MLLLCIIHGYLKVENHLSMSNWPRIFISSPLLLQFSMLGFFLSYHVSILSSLKAPFWVGGGINSTNSQFIEVTKSGFKWVQSTNSNGDINITIRLDIRSMRSFGRSRSSSFATMTFALSGTLSAMTGTLSAMPGMGAWSSTFTEFVHWLHDSPITFPFTTRTSIPHLKKTKHFLLKILKHLKVWMKNAVDLQC